MIRRPNVEIIDFFEGEEKGDIRYCKSCLEYNFEVPLRNRIYPDNEPIPVDHDQYLQCHTCGSIYALNEVEKEATIKDVIEKIENPLDIAKDEFLGVDNRTSIGGKKARRKREREKEFDYINDEELKRELKQGATLLSYSEQLP